MATTATTTTKKESKASTNSGADEVLLNYGIRPVLSVMKKAAAALKISVPPGKGDAQARELVGLLRMKIAELNSPIPVARQLMCEKCGERSTEDTEYCPYCGDLGIADEDDVPAATGAISNLPEVSPKRDVDGAMATLSQQLDQAIAAFSEAKRKVVGASYEMGEICKDIHDRQLYKAKGYDSFKQFVEAGELPVARTTAYSLIKVVEQFSREQYKELGYQKLRTIGLLESGEDRERMVSEAKAKGTSAREVEAKVKERRRGELPEPTRPATTTPPKQGDGKVTLLTKVDGKPKELRFKSAKNGAPLGSAGKISQYDAHAYAEVDLGNGVYIRIGLRVSGRDLVGLSAEIRRAEDEAPAAE